MDTHVSDRSPISRKLFHEASCTFHSLFVYCLRKRVARFAVIPVTRFVSPDGWARNIRARCIAFRVLFDASWVPDVSSCTLLRDLSASVSHLTRIVPCVIFCEIEIRRRFLASSTLGNRLMSHHFILLQINCELKIYQIYHCRIFYLLYKNENF